MMILKKVLEKIRFRPILFLGILTIHTFISNVNAIDTRIVNGDAVEDVDKYPFMVSLAYSGSGHSCGGSLIAPDVVLTAAHCVEGIVNAPDFVEVQLGRYDLSKYELYQTLHPSKIVLHPQYNNYFIRNDYAVLILNGTAADVFDFVPLHVGTPDPDNLVELEDRANVTIIGWGSYDTYTYTDGPLQEGVMHYVTHEDCVSWSAAFGNEVTEDVLCLGSLEQQTCYGDSGSPILADVDGVQTQVGIVSFGFVQSCDPKPFPEGYARVSYQYEWIRDVACTFSQHASETFQCDISPSSNPPPADPYNSCIDNSSYELIFSGVPIDCEWFANNPNRCFYYGSYSSDDYYYYYYYNDIDDDTDDMSLTANEACCVCGGGHENDEFNPAMSPSSSARPSTSCYDMKHWHDEASGITCDWLAHDWDDWWYDDGSVCDMFTYLHDSDGMTAAQACCSCGGGLDVDPNAPSDMPSFAMTTTPSKSSAPTLKCIDPELSQWHDWWGDGCDWYDWDTSINDDDIWAPVDGELSPMCLFYGDSIGTSNFTANEVCCACRGDPNVLPTLEDGSCISDRDWMDTYFYTTCDYVDSYYDDQVEPYDVCTLIAPVSDEDGVTATEACCSCGGGSILDKDAPTVAPSISLVPTLSLRPTNSPQPSTCDLEDWTDSYGDGCWYYEYYGCDGAEWYADNNGVSALDACCVCNYDNGHMSEDNWCADFDGWKDETFQVSCTFFSTEYEEFLEDDDWYSWYFEDDSDDDFDVCEAYGSITNSDGVSAVEACCGCGGGVEISLSPSISSVPTLHSTNPPTSSPESSSPESNTQPSIADCYDSYYWYLATPVYYLDCDDMSAFPEYWCGTFGNIPGSSSVTAYEACCACQELPRPSQSPSVSNLPSDIPSMSTKPTTSSAPTTTASPSTCDLLGWTDYYGYGCWFYEYYGCEYAQRYSDPNGVTAIEACCVCSDFEFPTHAPSISMEPSMSAAPTSICVDMQDWVNSYGWDCGVFDDDQYSSYDDYYNTDWYCLYYGYLENDIGVNASVACCGCGGGILRDPDAPSDTPSVSMVPTVSAHPTVSAKPSECEDPLPDWTDYYGDGCWFYEYYGCEYAEWYEDWNGVTAIDACCVCLDFVYVDDYYPTQEPSISMEPSMSAAPTSICVDMQDWVNSYGWDCGVFDDDQYSSYDDYYNTDWYCLYYGYLDNDMGVNASVACCGCGGGTLRDPDAPSDTPSVSMVPTVSTHPTVSTNPSASICVDLVPDWTDYYGNGCRYYEYYGCDYAEWDADEYGVTANEICCTCQSNLNENSSCEDWSAWTDSYGDGCWYYEYYGCEYAESYANGDGNTAYDACCHCGGGDNKVPTLSPVPTQSMSPTSLCTDFENWMNEEYLIDCAWFSMDHDLPEWYDDEFTTCQFGYLTDALGINASEACCECGGGSKVGDPLPPTLVCDDSSWKDVITDLECSFYETIYDCYYFYAEWTFNESGVNAYDGCCMCGGGEYISLPSNTTTTVDTALVVETTAYVEATTGTQLKQMEDQKPDTDDNFTKVTSHGVEITAKFRFIYVALAAYLLLLF